MNADDDRALRALDLATAGMSVAKIADMLDTTVKDVKALIKAGKRQDPRDYDPDVEARRLDKMSAAVKATAKLQKAHRAQVATRADTE